MTQTCNPHLRIFINGEEMFYRSFESSKSFDIGEYRSPKIPKTSLVRFEMLHNDELFMLNKTLSIKQLTERPHFTIFQEKTNNHITLRNSMWVDEFITL